MIDVSKENFQQWLSAKDADEIVGMQGQMYSNPVVKWLSEQVLLHLKGIENLYNWGMGVGIINLREGDGEGWYLDYHYSTSHPLLPGPGESSGEHYIRLPHDLHVTDFGIPIGSQAAPMTAQECLTILQN